MGNEKIFIGIDSGSQTTKGVVARQGAILAEASVYTDFDASAAAEAVLEKLLAQSGIARSDAASIAVTGANRQLVTFADTMVNEIVAAATGTHAVLPGARMVLDMGAESSRVISLTDDGAAKAYEINDRCASGAGTFIETCARALEIKPEEMGDYSARHTKDIPMKAQCVVFVESEVISLIHEKETKENIAHGVHLGIANRIGSMFRRLGIQEGIAFVGGPAKNQGLVECLKSDLEQDVTVPDRPEYIVALGAALYAEIKQARGNQE